MPIDRTAFEARLRANAVKPGRRLVDLPASGDQVWLLATLTKDMVQRAFVAAGDDDDQAMVGMPNLLKFLLVDEDGNPLPRTYAEARGWFVSLPDADAAIIMDELTRIVTDSTGDRDAEDLETPKGS